MSDEDHLSSGGAACMLLVWLVPTDRALTGWSPFCIEPAGMREADFARWLNGHLAVGSEELTSRHAAATHPNDMRPYAGW